MLFSLLLTSLRWLMTGFGVEYIGVLVLAQCIHAFSFGAMHACGIETIHQFFGGNHAGKGQALYGAVSFGAGSAIGSALMGEIWGSFGAQYVFVLSSVVVFFAIFVVYLWFKPAFNPAGTPRA